MGHLQAEVIRACQEVRVPFTALDREATQDIWKEVVARFGRNGRSPFWERLNAEHESVQDSTLWTQLRIWLQGQTVFLLFEEQDDNHGIRLQGESISEVIGEFFPFVFYLTNPTYDFLLCYNDHDFCIALGTATDWLITYQNTRPDKDVMP